MGLDSVELVMAVEDTFGIHLSDEEASKVVTVGDFHDLIASKLQANDSNYCLTSAAFYRTRRGIIEALGLNRRDIKPPTSLESILPKVDRRQKWQSIQNAMNLILPKLRHPDWLRLCFIGTGISLFVSLGLYAKLQLAWLPFLALLGFIIGCLNYFPGLAVEFPKGNKTVGDLSREVLAENYARLAEELGGSNKKDLWEVLSKLIQKQLGVTQDKIKPEARFVEDLGLN